MKFSTSLIAPESARTDLLITFVHTARQLSAAAQALDKASDGQVRKAVASGDITAKPGSTLLLRDLTHVSAQRVLLAGLGEKNKATARTWSEAVRAAFRAALNTGATNVAIAFEAPADRDASWAGTQLAVLAREAAYRFDRLKSEKPPVTTEIKSVTVLLTKAQEASVKAGLAAGSAIANGMDLTKDLGNLPGNHCTPTTLAQTAKDIGKAFKFKVEVLERKQLEALKMGSFLSVTRGSAEPPKFIVMEYRGGPAKQAPVVLVGKGITFDSGGISLKPGEAMDEMKYDMCGAGTVLGTMRSIAELKLKLNVVGIVASCENMPSGTATKPGDVVTSMSGQTIEILNTDAEGRLILCDALTYAERFKPAAVVDIATLTGACVVALGSVNTGLFSPNDALATQLEQAGRATLDTAWRMPVEDEYQELLKSNFADMANIGGRYGGAISAACFLARFTKKYDWAHLDIAGTAWKSGAAKGATGRPVPLLVEFLKVRAAA
jgi:leucyl aminopeptidase